MPLATTPRISAMVNSDGQNRRKAEKWWGESVTGIERNARGESFVHSDCRPWLGSRRARNCRTEIVLDAKAEIKWIKSRLVVKRRKKVVVRLTREPYFGACMIKHARWPNRKRRKIYSIALISHGIFACGFQNLTELLMIYSHSAEFAQRIGFILKGWRLGKARAW